MKETLSTIAARTGFSPATISRVLNGTAKKNRISKETVDKILADANECKYIPSTIANSLYTNSTNAIGLMLPSLSNPFFANMASALITEVSSRGYAAIIMDTMEDEKEFNDSAKLLLTRKVDGIIAVPCSKKSPIINKIDRSHLPVVLIERFYTKSNVSYVVPNNYYGGIMATKYLIENGHSKITCIQGDKDLIPNTERKKGYIDAMTEAGLKVNIEVVGESFSVDNGYKETIKLIQKMKRDRPTAIFALNNAITMGAIRAIKESGLSIPDDISIIAFDNYEYMDYIDPPIIRVCQPVNDMAKIAAKLLFTRIENPQSGKNSQIVMTPNITSGGSVKKIENQR